MTSTDFSSGLRPLPPRWAGIFICLRHLEPVESDRKIRTKPSEQDDAGVDPGRTFIRKQAPLAASSSVPP